MVNIHWISGISGLAWQACPRLRKCFLNSMFCGSCCRMSVPSTSRSSHATYTSYQHATYTSYQRATYNSKLGRGVHIRMMWRERVMMWHEYIWQVSTRNKQLNYALQEWQETNQAALATQESLANTRNRIAALGAEVYIRARAHTHTHTHTHIHTHTHTGNRWESAGNSVYSVKELE